MKSITFISAAALLCLALVACTSGGLELPSVTDSSGERLPGKIIWRDLIADKPEQTKTFYRELFGWEFEPLEGVNYSLIRHRGRLIGGLVDQNRLPAAVDVSQWVAVMSVEDIDAAAAAVSANGGTVLTPPSSLGARGRIAVITDSRGALLSLLQTRDGDPADAASNSRPGDFLWEELWTDAPLEAAAFLQALAPFAGEKLTLGSEEQPVPYQVLSTRGQPRAGLRPLPDAALPPTWVSYLQVADETALESILGRVPALGGRVLVPAIKRPRGGSVALVADPSGAGIGLQTWSEQQRTARGEKQ